MSDIVSIHSDAPTGASALPEDPAHFGALIGRWNSLNVSLSGALVDSVADLAQNLNPLVGTTTTRPTLVAAGWDSASPKPLINLDGVSQRLLAPGFAPLLSGADNPFAFFLALKWNVVAVAKYVFSLGSSLYVNPPGNPDPRVALIANTSTPQRYRAVIAQDNSNTTNIDAAAGNNISTARQIVSLVCNGAQVGMWVNGTLITTTDHETWSRTQKTLDLFAVGCLVRGSSGTVYSAFANLGFAEILAYDGLLSSAQRLAVEAYMEAAWPVI